VQLTEAIPIIEVATTTAGPPAQTSTSGTLSEATTQVPLGESQPDQSSPQDQGNLLGSGGSAEATTENSDIGNLGLNSEPVIPDDFFVTEDGAAQPTSTAGPADVLITEEDVDIFIPRTNPPEIFVPNDFSQPATTVGLPPAETTTSDNEIVVEATTSKNPSGKTEFTVAPTISTSYVPEEPSTLISLLATSERPELAATTGQAVPSQASSTADVPESPAQSFVPTTQAVVTTTKATTEAAATTPAGKLVCLVPQAHTKWKWWALQ